MNSQPLKILHLEDLKSDAELVERVLQKSDIGFEKLLVSNKEDFMKALSEFHPDIILSDHSLPSFDSHEALKIVNEMELHVPFILITATVSEEYAVDVMKEGAWDYILKDRLQRLPNAIQSAMNKYRLVAERKLAYENLRSSEQKYKLLFERNPLPMWMIETATSEILDVNEAAIQHYGYTKEEFLQMKAVDLGKKAGDIWQHRKKDGMAIMVDIIEHDILYEDRPARLILVNDVTEKIKAEAELTQQRARQQKLIAETSIQAQEKEREEIGKELHDNINQILSSVKLYLEFALAEKDEMTWELMAKSYKSVCQAIEEIRRLSHQLVAPSQGTFGLRDAIVELIEDIHTVSALNFHFEAGNYEEVLISRDVKLMFYRVVQEQINNILKHADAKNAFIRLCAASGEVVLTVEDDGVGFDAGNTSHGIGLRNISNRAGHYGGGIRIGSAPGKGCTLEVRVPVDNIS